jgi:hypothetical protein
MLNLKSLNLKSLRVFNLTETINKIKTNLTLPTEEDYEGAIVALHRLEDTYLLDPKDIKNGILSDKNPSRSLTGNLAKANITLDSN